MEERQPERWEANRKWGKPRRDDAGKCLLCWLKVQATPLPLAIEVSFQGLCFLLCQHVCFTPFRLLCQNVLDLAVYNLHEFVTHSFGACKVQDQDASRLGFWWEPVSQTQSLLSVSSACWKGQTSSLGICFKKDFYLGGNERGRERENRKSFQHLFYFPNASNGPWLELGAVNSIQVSHVSAAAQSLKASLLPPRICRSRKLESVAGGGHWARELGYRLNVWPSIFTTRWNSNSMYEIRTFMS